MHKQFSGSARALCQLVRVQLMNHETHSVKCSKIWTLLSVPVRQRDPPQLLEQWLPASWVSETDFCGGGLSGEFEFSFGVSPCYHYNLKWGCYCSLLHTKHRGRLPVGGFTESGSLMRWLEVNGTILLCYSKDPWSFLNASLKCKVRRSLVLIRS